MVYADNGINWEFLYAVEYEDDCILVLRDMGRFHKFDDDRMYKGKIDAYIEVGRDGWARTPTGRKLVEVKPELR